MQISGGGAELRWAFAKLTLGVPGEIGLMLGANTGRVWLEGEEPDTWHPGYGAGVFFVPFKRLALIELGFGTSSEQTFFVLAANLTTFGF